MPSAADKILITGATGKIGSEIARALCPPGGNIALHFNKNAKQAGLLKSELEQSGSGIFLIESDISNASAAKKLVEDAAKKMGGLNIFVHAAAIFERTPFKEATEEQWDRIIAINLKAPFFMAQEAGIKMECEGGRMIFLSDVAAVKPYAGYLPYCIAKAGIDALVKGLAKSLAPKVAVNAIAPYVVTRPAGISDGGWNDLLSKMPMRSPQTAGEIAAIVKMLASECKTVTGQIITVDGGRLLR